MKRCRSKPADAVSSFADAARGRERPIPRLLQARRTPPKGPRSRRRSGNPLPRFSLRSLGRGGPRHWQAPNREAESPRVVYSTRTANRARVRMETISSAERPAVRAIPMKAARGMVQAGRDGDLPLWRGLGSIIPRLHRARWPSSGTSCPSSTTRGSGTDTPLGAPSAKDEQGLLCQYKPRSDKTCQTHHRCLREPRHAIVRAGGPGDAPHTSDQPLEPR